MSLTAIQTQGQNGTDGMLVPNGVTPTNSFDVPPYQFPYVSQPTYQSQGTFVQTLMSQSILKIAPALLKAQQNFSKAIKDSANPYFKSKFADLNSVLGAVLPALHSEGVVLLQPIVQKDGRQYVRTLLIHTSGEFIGSDTEVITKNGGTAQETGSGISYSRRYGLQSLLSVQTQDDDASAASGTVQQEQQVNKPRSSFSKNKPVPAAVEPVTETDDGWK